MNRADLEALSREQLIELVPLAELEAKPGLPPKTPENSSLPPSHGRKPPGGRKRKGRRKSRPGVARALDPNPTQVREVRAACCPALPGRARGGGAGAARGLRPRRDPADPPRGDAGDADGRHLPALCQGLQGRAAHGHGARLAVRGAAAALALHLRFSQNIGFDRLAAVFRDVLGVGISQGGLVNIVRSAAAAFAAQVARLRERLLESPVMASDETGLRVAGRNCWLWVMHHGDSAVFRAEPSRAKRVLADFLGEHRPDFWISDRYGGQKGFATRGHQFCLAHLIRDAQYAIDAGDTGFAPGFLALLKRACRVGGIRDRLSDRQLAAYQRKFVKKLSELLQRPPTHPQGSKLQTAIAKGRGNLFLFVTNRDLEPTNNGSERALRPCATFRKVTGGFRTREGAAFYADARSVQETARRRGIPPLQAILLTLQGHPLPLQHA